jgi:hypothetical protein
MTSLPDETNGRRFSLLDGMVLIAAFAVCWMVPRTFKALVPVETYRIYDIRQYAQIILASWLMVASVSLATLTLIVPKPDGRERFRHPGVLAMVLVALTWAFDMAQTGVQGLMLRWTTGKTFENGAFWPLFGPIYDATFRAGLAVLAGWITLVLLGAGRPSRDWLDRSGRVLGWIWVVWGPLAWVIEYQTIFNRSDLLNIQYLNVHFHF